MPLAVDEVMGNAVAAGGGVVKETAASQWNGYFGYFSDQSATSGRSHLLLTSTALIAGWTDEESRHARPTLDRILDLRAGV